MSEESSANWSSGEEIANVAIHGLGVVLSGAGFALLVVFASLYGDAWHVVSSAVYGSTLVVLYTASTVYHAVLGSSPRAKRVAQLIDHSAIYLLIAGTYTPFTLITLRGPWGWWLFGTIWSLAVTGVALEWLWARRPRVASAPVYLAMSWIVVVAVRPLMASLPRPGLWLLLAGGLAYSFGTIFYGMKTRYMHAVWHLFVLGGSICHFLAVVLYVVPGRR